MTTKVKELLEQRNQIESQIWGIEKEITDKNTVVLHNEISNLIDGVGKGYVEGDYYADTRYYSEINGVKNIRFGREDEIVVKIISPSGWLIPDVINVKSIEFKLSIAYSSKYKEMIDY